MMWVIRKNKDEQYELGYYFGIRNYSYIDEEYFNDNDWFCLETSDDKELIIKHCHYLNGGN